MQRRNFLRLGLLGSGVSLFTSQLVLADSESTPTPSAMAGGLYYTKNAPGRWSKKAAGHLPQITIKQETTGALVQVITPHEMKGYKHYIIKHILLDKNYQFVAENMFDPTKDPAPISHFSLNDYRGTIYALSVCNKHDTWLSQAAI